MVAAMADSRDDMNFTAKTLGAITARTLIVHGDRDPLYPTELAIDVPLDSRLAVVDRAQRRTRADLRPPGAAIRQGRD